MNDVVERLSDLEPLQANELSEAMLDAIDEITALRFAQKSLAKSYNELSVDREIKREALITIAERLDDAGCQCDSSDEYVYKCNLCTANDALANRNP